MKRSADTERLLGDLIAASRAFVEQPTRTSRDNEFRSLLAVRDSMRHDARNELSVDQMEAEIMAGMAAEEA